MLGLQYVFQKFRVQRDCVQKTITKDRKNKKNKKIDKRAHNNDSLNRVSIHVIQRVFSLGEIQ